MAVILGIDLGTSNVKAMLLDSDRGIISSASRGYDVDIPQIGWAEQSPELWWRRILECLAELKAGFRKDFDAVAAIGFASQMHGLVMLGRDGRPLYPAVIWLDQRAAAEAAEIESVYPPEKTAELFRNSVPVGFALPSLLWMKRNRPEIYLKIDKIMLPKDYIRFRLTGLAGCEYSDASASAAFSMPDKNWAFDLLERLDIDSSMFPPLSGSSMVAGTVTKGAAAETGLCEGIPVVHGSGDQQAQSIGNGAVKEGIVTSNIGTSGQVAAFSGSGIYDPQLRTHTFCHAADNAYSVFGAILCGGISLKWLKNGILRTSASYEQLISSAAEVTPGSGGVIFLPYLTGERTPHMDPAASGMFFGLKLGHEQNTLCRAVMEGVVLSLNDSLVILKEIGVKPDRLIAAGGGTASPLWLQMQADIFNTEIEICTTPEQSCMGACIVAGSGTGIFSSIEEACSRHVKYSEKTYSPNPVNAELYAEQFLKYRKLYENNKELMHT